MVDLHIQRYDDSLAEKWDKFVLRDSFNGTFLQTRNFLDYHPKGRFEDASLVIWKGTSDILAVVPAGAVGSDGQGKGFSSHPGSTFGGLVFGSAFYNLDHVKAVFETLENYLVQEGYTHALFKQSPQTFSSKSNDLLEYFFFQRGWRDYRELSFVIDLENYADDIISNFTSSRRRDYRYGVRHGLEFRKLSTRQEIAGFYEMLCKNLEKFDASPVHTLDELHDFHEGRLAGIAEFFGVFSGRKLIAGSMVFRFDKTVFHTQYLVASQEDLKLFPNNFMDANLIRVARDEGFRWFSFGISTEEHGRVLNERLARFKEGFGTTYCNNKVFTKELA